MERAVGWMAYFLIRSEQSTIMYLFIYLFDCVVNIRSILVLRNGIKNSQKHPLCQCYLTETGSKQGHEEATEALTRMPILTKEKYKMIYCVKNKA